MTGGQIRWKPVRRDRCCCGVREGVSAETSESSDAERVCLVSTDATT